MARDFLRIVVVVLCFFLVQTSMVEADQIIDNDTLGFSLIGSWDSSTLVPGYYGSDYRWTYAGSGEASAEWVFEIPTDGYYRVLAWWSTPHPDRSPDAPFTIYHAAGSTTVEVDQTIAGSQWNELGIFHFLAGEARVVLTNDTSGNPVADAVRIVEQTSVVAEFEAEPLSGEAPLSVSFQNLSIGDIDTFLWDFGDGVTSTEPNPTHVYALPGLYTVSLEVFGAGGSDIETKANLITVTEAGAFEVIIDNDSPDVNVSGEWFSSTTVPGYYGNDYLWTYGHEGKASAEWTFELPYNGYYRVLAWWSAPYDTRSPDAPYTIHHADGRTTVDVNQRINGGQWNELGVFYFTTGVGRVVLRNDAEGVPVADAVRVVRVGGSDTLNAFFTAYPTAGRDSLEVDFLDLSSGPVEAWLWDFGDGEVSTEQNPLHVYEQPGTYTVSLTVTGAGQETSQTRVGYINVIEEGDVAQTFTWPIASESFFILQAFGNSRLEVPGLLHAATDFGVYEYDVEVRCIANGFVESFEGDGHGITIRHILPNAETVYSSYSHLAHSAEDLLTIGQFVPIGTVLGTVGESGWAPSGIHLHLEVSRQPYFQGGYVQYLTDYFNPYEFIFSRLVYNPDPPDQCSDGTLIGDCSMERPLRCIEGGYLIENSLVCGCEVGVPQGDGTCSKTETGIIVDNNDPEFEYSGDWYFTTLRMGFYGSDYLVAYAGASDSTASWTPYVPESGYYRIYGWWKDRFGREGSSRAANATIVINHAGEQDQVTVDFTDFHKGWKYLGTYVLAEGSNNSVVLSGTWSGDVVADAFRFVWDSPSGISARFTGSPTGGSTPLTVQFTDTSIGEISSWFWDFGDGNTSTLQNPSHQYVTEGVYTVFLTVTGPGGNDTETKLDYISVSSTPTTPTANFEGTPTSGTPPLTVQFTDTSIGEILSWFWDFGDESTSTLRNPSHQYVTEGMYTVSLTVSGPGGNDTLWRENYVVVTQDFVYDEIVDNDAPGFSLIGSWYPSTLVPGFYGNNYRWTYAGSGDVSAQYVFQIPSDGYYRVLGWWSAPYDTRSPNAPFTVHHASGSTTIEADQTVNGGQWNELGIFYFSEGEARVVLTDDAIGNPVADAVRIVELTSVVADFRAEPLFGEAPLSVTFENRSYGDINSFLWQFGDGITSTQESPIHEYVSPGVYAVTLEVVGPWGSDIETKTDLVTVTEAGAFDMIVDNDSPDFGLEGTWYPSTLVPGYYGSDYLWTLGGGGETEVSSAQWSFQLPSDGYYLVSAWWCAPYDSRSPDAPYTVHHADGSTMVDVDQRINGSQWNELGTFYFLAGEARVVLTNDAEGVPVADAVRMMQIIN